jgi:hypothetical protein
LFGDGASAFAGVVSADTSPAFSLPHLHAGVDLTVLPASPKGEAPVALEYEANGELELANEEKGLAGRGVIAAAGLGDGIFARSGRASGPLGSGLGCKEWGVEQGSSSATFRSACNEGVMSI